MGNATGSEKTHPSFWTVKGMGEKYFQINKIPLTLQQYSSTVTIIGTGILVVEKRGR